MIGASRELNFLVMRTIRYAVMLIAPLPRLQSLAYAKAGREQHGGAPVSSTHASAIPVLATNTPALHALAAAQWTNNDTGDGVFAFLQTHTRNAHDVIAIVVDIGVSQPCTGGCCCPDIGNCPAGSCAPQSVAPSAHVFDLATLAQNRALRTVSGASLLLILNLDQPPKF